MLPQPQKQAVLFLTNDRMELYMPDMANILTYYFSDKIVRDLEVVDQVALDLDIQSFVTRNQLFSVEVYILLSETVYFAKDLVEDPSFHLDIEIGKFIENVPFENTTSRIYKAVNTTKFVVANKDFLEAIRVALVNQGLLVWAVVPACIVGEGILSLTRQTGEHVLAKTDIMKQNTLLSEMPSMQSASQKQNAKKEKKQTGILLAVFIILLIILGIMLYQNAKSQSGRGNQSTSRGLTPL
ncbi:hypothetical protein A2960_04300 [Candidatus Gottesmanbacteria bacterium RIFCSPLOWO2_01_FULL_39_12b]|uniref:Uncharacterized protein n=1 Tax=Candidatus Gottesmanbacteria bacterium RIFCSPLOWO2_01_FULL_39_12b TaxID=1798388 RepID=A0A1F6AS29_9BACT|nr:MAG: hypothetical protein A2960_04300 [Candidatus Gottesmanbacteria bacterium RIFCSPLOWO2_01_FULL_39_12b]